MKKLFVFGRSIKLGLGVALCLVGVATLTGCNKSQDNYAIEDDEAVAVENSGGDSASWDEFKKRLTQSESAVGAGFGAVGSTGSAPASFVFSASGATGDAPAAFNFNAAASTGDAPAAFNFNAAASTGDAPAAFNFNAAASTSDAPEAFHFSSAAGATGDAPAAFKLGAADDSGASARPDFNFGAFAKRKSDADKAAAKAANALAQAETVERETSEEFKKLQAVASEKRSALDEVVKIFEEAFQKSEVANKQFSEISEKTKQAEEQLKTLESALVASSEKLASAATSKTEAERKVADATKNVDETAASVEAASKAANSAKEQLTRATDARVAASNAAKEAEEGVKRAASAKSDAEKGVAVASEEVAKAAESLAAAQKTADDAASAVEGKEGEEKARAEEAVKTSIDALNVAKETKNAADEAKNVAEQLLASRTADFNSANATKDATAKLLSETVDKMTTAEKANSSAERALVAATEKHNAATKAKSDAEKELLALTANLNSMKDENASSTQSVSDAKAKLEALRNEVSSSEKTRKEASTALEEAKALRDKSQKEFDGAAQASSAAEQKANAAKRAKEDAAVEKETADKAAKELSSWSPSGKTFFFSSLNDSYSSESESRFPTAQNLESAIDALVELIDRDVEDLDMIPDFEDGCVGIRRDANSLAVVALVLGASDVESKRKASAPELIKVARGLAAAKSEDEVKEAYGDLATAHAVVGTMKPVDWEKVASLKPLMKNAVPAFSTEIKRLSRNEKTFLRAGNAKKVIDKSTILFSIAMGCREDADETQAPEDEELWKEYCDRLASAALDFNELANAVVAGNGSFEDLKAAYKAVEQTCNSTCHEKFGGGSAE